MHCPKKCLDIVGKAHKFNKQCFIQLKFIEVIIFLGKNKANLDISYFCFLILMYSSIGK